jgi:hypothetical protein
VPSKRARKRNQQRTRHGSFGRRCLGMCKKKRPGVCLRQLDHALILVALQITRPSCCLTSSLDTSFSIHPATWSCCRPSLSLKHLISLAHPVISTRHFAIAAKREFTGCILALPSIDTTHRHTSLRLVKSLPLHPILSTDQS